MNLFGKNQIIPCYFFHIFQLFNTIDSHKNTEEIQEAGSLGGKEDKKGKTIY